MQQAAAAGVVLSVILLLFSLAALALWFVALVHCISKKHDKDRMLWVIVVLFGGPIGALLYWFMGRPKMPPRMHSGVAPSASSPPLISNPAIAFDHLAIRDEKKRAESINAALGLMAASKRRNRI